MPAAAICFLIAIFLLWNKPIEVNKWMLLAMLGLILTAAFTNIYFIPKHKKLFLDDTAQTNIFDLKKLATQ